MSAPDDATTLGEARAWLRARVDAGETCPCCTQYAKVYRRALPAATARVMIALWHNGGAHEFVHLPPILDTLKGTPRQGGYGVLGQFWGLLEQQTGHRDDGSNRVGWWRLTSPGRDFVLGYIRVPKYARIYNGRVLNLEGETVNIVDALGTKFNYDNLMQGI